MTEDRLIAENIVNDSCDRRVEEARLREQGVPVWVLIDYLNATAGDIESAAVAYDLSSDAVRAAIAFYHQHKPLLDAYIVVETSGFA